MVLDSKQMDWASRTGLDTAALKRAKVPIYGKWYFPDLPANEPLVNLNTGQEETFPAGYRAGAVLYVKVADLKRAGLGGYQAEPAPAATTAPAVAAPPAPAVAAAPAAPVRAATAVASAPAAHAAPAHQPAPPASHPEPSQHVPHGSVPVVEHAHPGAKTYIVIALILSVITAVEVWVYYIPALLPFIFPILIVLSIVKFVMVVGWFMHLKFDHVSFTWYFGGGLGLALTLVLALIVLQIGTHGLPPGNGNAEIHPSSYPSVQPPGGPGSNVTTVFPGSAPAAGGH